MGKSQSAPCTNPPPCCGWRAGADSCCWRSLACCRYSDWAAGKTTTRLRGANRWSRHSRHHCRIPHSGTAAGPVMASMRGWPVVITGIASGFGRISAIMPAIRAGLMGAFLAPGAALTSRVKPCHADAQAYRPPCVVGMITGAVSVLGGALSFLLSPIGLIGAAFVAAGCSSGAIGSLSKPFSLVSLLVCGRR